MPPDVLDELEPGYFHGNLLQPVLGNLTPLHFSLDEIRLAVSPPQQVMDQLERVVRRQTARALRLQDWLDSLAGRFLDDGGQLFIVDGAPSERLFPDPSLPAFEPLHLYVLEADAPLLRKHLEPAGKLEFTTTDPVLSGERIELEVTSGWAGEIAELLADGDRRDLPTPARRSGRCAGGSAVPVQTTGMHVSHS